MKLPKLYAILDRGTLDARGISVRSFAAELRDGGVRLLQYRDKQNAPQEILRAAREIAEVFAGTNATLLLNDRADLAALLHWGCHVGQDDLAVHDVLAVTGPHAIVGVSTHNDAQVSAADQSPASYVAVGPVFVTTTKENPDPIVGLDGVRTARALTSKPLVAIGGITAANARSVIQAGADSVAIISGLLPQSGRSVREVVAEMLESLG